MVIGGLGLGLRAFAGRAIDRAAGRSPRSSSPSLSPLLSRSSKVWALTAALGLAATGLYVEGVAPLPALSRPLDVDWWLIAVLYGLAEVLVVHLQFRRDTHSFSLSEIPLVAGLFFLAPSQLIPAMLLGTGAALALHRRQPPVKLVFNLANLAFTTSLAVLLFRVVLRSADPIGLWGWVAAFTASISADIVSVVFISCAIGLASGQPPAVRQIVGSGTVAAFFNTCLGLVTVIVLWIYPEAVWLPLVLAALMVAAYRIYGSVRQKHESLEFLYESTRPVQDPPDVERVVGTLLAQAREMFRAGDAELLLLPSQGEPGLEARLSGDDALNVTSLSGVDPTRGVWARVASEGKGVCLPRPIANERLRAYFDDREIRDAIVAPLWGPDTVVGTLLVGNRSSAVSTFAPDDLKLLETFANHASASIENARLIERLRSHAEETQRQALHDALTGLPNRTFFHRQVADALGAGLAAGRAGAVLLMDLDRFKDVNDSLGHHNGDLLLQAVAARLRATVRPVDLVARLGGDEFGILLTGLEDTSMAESLAERLLAALTVPFVIQELSLEVGGSIGIALYPADGEDVDTLLQRADVAMYQAKSSLTGHVRYSPDLDSHSPDRLLLLAELRRALDEHQLRVAYQPKVDLRTGAIVGAEALVRWLHPRRGMLSPDEFIPVVEHTGLLRPLTLFVLETAVADASRWRSAGHALSVAVNLSVRNLLDAELPDAVARLLERYGFSAADLELEITETALLADPVRTAATLERLHGLGAQISIDDFGTGYSSLSYLRRMPVDEIKIDRSFVTGMNGDENDALIVRSTIDLGRNLGLRVVAEGVETRQVEVLLRRLGCDVAQGYYFGRPVPEPEFLQLLADRAPSLTPQQQLVPAPTPLHTFGRRRIARGGSPIARRSASSPRTPAGLTVGPRGDRPV